MKKIILLLGVAFSGIAIAQVTGYEGRTGITTEKPFATLDIEKNPTSKLNGILIPRVTKAEAEAMGQNTGGPATDALKESTMVYISDATAANGTYTSKVDAKGFYYFDGTEWVKVGGAAVATKTFTARTEQTASSGYDWTDGGKGLVDFYEFTSYSSAITLPDPTSYSGTTIYVRNNTGGTRNFGGADGIGTPKGVSSLVATGAMTVWSDGTAWHNISGRQ